MDYFCYISRSKVDQLYQTITEVGDVDEWVEQQITENNINTSLETGFTVANIVSLFKSGITYGRKGLIQREKKIKMSYVEKLKHVLLKIKKEGPIPSLNNVIEELKFDSIYYHYQGMFKVDPPLGEHHKTDSSTIITIKSECHKNNILLDCSLRFFSEGNEPDGTFLIHSGNSRFFGSGIELCFETVFVLLGKQENVYVGTPLFLKLISTTKDNVLISL